MAEKKTDIKAQKNVAFAEDEGRATSIENSRVGIAGDNSDVHGGIHQETQGSTVADKIEKVEHHYHGSQKKHLWAFLRVFFFLALASGILYFLFFHKRTPSFAIEKPVLRYDADMIIMADNKSADRPEPLNIEFDGVVFNRKGIPVENKKPCRWSFTLNNHQPSDEMVKEGYHSVRMGFPAEKLSEMTKIVFINTPPVLGVESIQDESDPDTRIIRGKAASPLQIPENVISVDVVYFHDGPAQEIDVPVTIEEDDDTGIRYFRFETSVQGLPKIAPDDPRYSLPFFGFRITDQAGNEYYQEQSYAQYMSPGSNRFGFNRLAMIKFERLPEDSGVKDVIKLTPMEMSMHRQLSSGEPAIILKVRGFANRRQLTWQSNVPDSKPITLVFRDEEQIGTSFTNEYTDDKALEKDTVTYTVGQEGKDGTKYRSYDEIYSKTDRVTVENEITNSVGMKFVYIESGTFMMGSPESEKGRDNDEKQHKVTLTKDFYMQTTEVTQGQWKEVMGEYPPDLRFKDCGDYCPVEKVSWNDVQEVIKKLKQMKKTEVYRLPTEAEWEYAARAETDTAYCFGDDVGKLGKYAWYDDNSGGKPHPVGQKKPNVWGLYDMHGNVWEWCQDWFGDYPATAVTDSVGPKSGSARVLRGGSWGSFAEYCRSASRLNRSPGLRHSGLGFRLSRGQLVL